MTLVTGNVREFNNVGEFVSGKIAFTPSVAYAFLGESTLLRTTKIVDVDASGDFTVELTSGNDPNVQPQGFTYRVELTGLQKVNGVSRVFRLDLNADIPYKATPVNLNQCIVGEVNYGAFETLHYNERIKALEVLAGLAPGDLSDETVRALVDNPSSLTGDAIRQLLENIDAEAVGGSTQPIPGTLPMRGAGGSLPGIGEPVNASDAATKGYTDSRVDNVLHDIDESFAMPDVRFPVAFDISTVGAPVGDRLTIPTHISPAGGQATHPSVAYFPDGWNGYRYWMAHTPYPASNDAHEDPNIVASHDGTKWVVPAGLVNPLDDAPGTPNYNSDTELVYANSKLWCFWRYQESDNTGSNSQRIYVRASENGIDWTPKQLVQQSNYTAKRLVSPTLIFESGKWTMWAVDIAVTPNRLVRYVSKGDSPLLGEWGTEQSCDLTAASGRDLWHIQVKRVGEKFIGLLNDCVSGQAGANGDLYLIESVDGLKWTRSNVPVINRVATGEYTALYRSSFVPGFKDGQFGLHVWYVGWTPGATPVWNIYRSFISDTTGWIPLNVSTGWDVLAGHTPRGRINRARLEVTGAVVRKAGGLLDNICSLPSSLKDRLIGTGSVFGSSHVAKNGATYATCEIYLDYSTGRIRTMDYNTLDSAAGWNVPISTSFPSNIR